VLAIVACGACDRVIGLYDIHPGGDAAGPQPCTMPALHDDFTMTTSCGTWGTPSGMVVEGNGKLTITPSTNGTMAGCTTTTYVDFTQAVFVAVPSVTLAGDSLVQLSEQAADTSQVSALVEFSLSSGAAELNLLGGTGNATQTYDATKMLWWRLRPAPEGVYGEFSADGMRWYPLGLAQGTAPTTAMIRLTAENFAGFSLGDAVFQHFDICP
jgi:hypothetical protein